MDELNETINLISQVITDEPPIDLKIGGLIKDGVSEELDLLKDSIKGSKDWVNNLEQKERERTGINSLKVKYNQVFGYYIEITKSNLESVPEDYYRKQTLVNAERFITPELKHHEEIILSAEEKIKDLEYKLFLDYVTKILLSTPLIQDAAKSISALDCLINFADLAESENYCRPEIIETGEIIIKDGRHPVVEKLLEESTFVPNDVDLNTSDKQLLIITGPNMTGKSVYIRQTALLVLMAQIGSFVPATTALISLVDKIFVRSGASDVITSGLSTFMVEMVETANILNHATTKSLIVMDEIGRGTSTYDGVSIAWAVAEFLITNTKMSPKTLFATHYHELQKIEADYPNKAKNFQVSAIEKDGELNFLHKVMLGGSSHSYGIAVAKLAGVPKEVTQKALQILQLLESKSNTKFDFEEWLDGTSRDKNLYNSNNIVKMLNEVDIDKMTPIEAISKLNELKTMLKKAAL
jgi:DNA mismatch repair protein MutS